MSYLGYIILGFICAVHPVWGEVPELSILVADWAPPKIVHVNLSDATVNVVPIKSIHRPVAIDFDPESRDIYWTDVLLFQIRATNILGTSDRILKSFDNSSVLDGLAVDVSNNKLFYTDAGNDVIAVMDLNGNNSKDIIDTGLDQPRAIVLHEEIRKLYWADWGDAPFISSANYDGTDERKIVTSGLVWPNGLTLDKRNNIIYWCDAQTHKIESVNVNGTQRRTIINEPLAHYFDIFLNHGALYFTDWRRRAVLNLPAEGGTIGAVVLPHFTHLAGIHVYSNLNAASCESSQQYGRNCEDCGKCKPNSVCEKITGFCLAGCSPGYEGKHCKQECSIGKYGDKCQSVCGNCARGGCNHVDGRCMYGCTSGWHGIDCKTECPVNNYGSSCVPCGRCANGDVCNQLSGNCPNGCKDGWTGDRCDSECPINNYGPSCVPCGRCANGDVCNQFSGNCPNGCQDGWTGDRCDSVTTEDEDDNWKTGDTNNHSLVVVVGAAAGGVAVLLIVVVIIIVVAVVLLRRRTNSDRNPGRQNASLHTVGQSDIYRTDLPPAYSTITDIRSSTHSDGYDSLREYRPYTPSPRYERLGRNHQSPHPEPEDSSYITPLSFELEDEKENKTYTAVA